MEVTNLHRMKDRNLLLRMRNKLAGMTVLGLAACQSTTVYHSYLPVPTGGWEREDTLVYALPSAVPVGEYEVNVGIRYLDAYPYRDIWLGISSNAQDTLHYVTDTLQLFLADETGNRTGSGSGGLYQCTLPYKMTFPILQEGQNRTIRVVQIMKDHPLKGISDVGIQIRKK